MLQSQEISRGETVTGRGTEAPEAASVQTLDAATNGAIAADKTPWHALLAVPLAAAVTLGVHLVVSKKEPLGESRSYTIFLTLFFAGAIAAALTQWHWPAVRARMRGLRPLFTASVLLLCAWELITSGFRLLPLPYFPSPAGVLQSMINDRALLFDSTWHSLVLLLGGYGLGVASGFITGVCIGWSKPVRYWGMPLLKVVGPIPATAWIPLALVVAESVGVKSGLGWYVSWAQGWAEYGKVYASLVIMAAFFSTIMTLLFKLRDRVLVWQKGMIKW